MSLPDDIIEFIETGGGPSKRDELARRLFEDQCEAIPEYIRYARGVSCTGIVDIPPVPETVYKGTPPRRSGPVVRVFRSSGTSGRTRTTIEISEAGLAVMNAAILQGAHSHLMADGMATRFLLLTPSPKDAPDIIMVHGMDLIAHRYGINPPEFFVFGGKIDFPGVVSVLHRSTRDGIPVTLAGGSLTFVYLLDYCAASDFRIVLPEGSRTLDAGGYKSRSRELSPQALSSAITATLGVPRALQHNILGMTELASQFYSDGSLLYETDEYIDANRALQIKRNDPWTNTTVVEPGRRGAFSPLGMLCHTDLATYDRPCALLTADIGLEVDGGFCFVRRARKNAVRGCALNMESAGIASLNIEERRNV